MTEKARVDSTDRFSSEGCVNTSGHTTYAVQYIFCSKSTLVAISATWNLDLLEDAIEAVLNANGVGNNGNATANTGCFNCYLERRPAL